MTADSARLSEDETDKSAGNWARDYADDFFDYHQYGDDGVLMLISLDPRQVWDFHRGCCDAPVLGCEVTTCWTRSSGMPICPVGTITAWLYIFLDHVELNLEQGWNEGDAGEAAARLLTKRYLTDTEVKTLLIAVAIAACSFVFIRLRAMRPGLCRTFTMSARGLSRIELSEQDRYVTSHTSTVRVSSGSGGSGGSGGGGGGGFSSHSGSEWWITWWWRKRILRSTRD